MDRSAIEKMIPHRDPFLWIDGVEDVDAGKSCVAWMRVHADHAVFRGHFPDRPVLPGVLMIEAMAQSAAVMMGAGAIEEGSGTALLAAVNHFRFYRPVNPGTRLRIEVVTLTRVGSMTVIEGNISCDGEKIAYGELSIVSGR